MKPPPAAVSKHASAAREKRPAKPRKLKERAQPPKTIDEAREREVALHHRWADARRQRDEMRAAGTEPSSRVLARVLNLHHRWRAMARLRRDMEMAAKRSAWLERVEEPQITEWPYALTTATQPSAPTREEMKAAERVMAAEEEDLRARAGHGLSSDRRTAAGQRELEREDARRVALNGRRHPLKDRHDTLFHERRQDHTPARSAAAARFDDAYHVEHIGQFRSPDYLQQKVDTCARPASFGFGGSYTYPEIVKVVGFADMQILIKRIIQGMRWQGIARDEDQSERTVGIRYRDALQRIVDRFEMEKQP